MHCCRRTGVRQRPCAGSNIGVSGVAGLQGQCDSYGVLSSMGQRARGSLSERVWGRSLQLQWVEATYANFSAPVPFLCR